MYTCMLYIPYGAISGKHQKKIEHTTYNHFASITHSIPVRLSLILDYMMIDTFSLFFCFIFVTHTI